MSRPKSERQTLIDRILHRRRLFLEAVEALAQHDKTMGYIRRPVNINALVVTPGMIRGLIVKHS